MNRPSRRDRRTGSSYARGVWYNAFRLTREGCTLRGYERPKGDASRALRNLLDTDAYLAARIAAPSSPNVRYAR
jgi:hypothetical protein